ncbi:MAG: ATPase [Bacteroidales bacterium]|nr:ATPase [Bacteroidales bacterium]
MQLIADSGSTKTHWSLITPEGVKNFRTMGLNPFFNGASMAEEEINKHPLLQQNLHRIKEVHFYGAGCGYEKNTRMMTLALQHAFPRADVRVNSDLLGAARGLFLDQKGIACILGTGSNSGLYNGKHIVRNTPALGYILGDEGSGNHLGKNLLRAYIHHDMPDELRKKFREQHPETPNALLYELYHHPYPNRFLAEFSPFIHKHMDHRFMSEMVSQTFGAFLALLQKHYPNEMLHSIRLTGSVAWSFREILEETAQQMNMNITEIEASPLEGLIQYHAAAR